MNQKYLVVFESEGVGEIYGLTNDINSAKELMDSVFNQKENVVSFSPNRSTPLDCICSYTYHSSCELNLDNCPTYISNGVSTVYVFDTHKTDSFTIDKFIYERANTVFLFNIQQNQSTNTEIVGELKFLSN